MRAPRVCAVTLAAALLGGLLGSGCGDGNGGPSPVDEQLTAVLQSRGVTALDPGPAPPPGRVALGQALFFDRELSGNRDIACATCHHPSLMGGDALSVSIGTGGAGLGPDRQLGPGRSLIPRNAPEVFNRGAPLWTSMFWDSRVAGIPGAGFTSPAGSALPAGLESVLAVQAMFPITSPDEMRGVPGDVDVLGAPNELAEIDDRDLPAIWDAIMDRLLVIPAYRALFAAAFPGTPVADLGFEHAATAIADFEVAAFTLLDSPWDLYLMGDYGALSGDAKQGALLFYGDAGCASCHAGSLLTDQRHHSICAPQVGPGKGAEAPLDFGRGRETDLPADRFAFRTAPLRNVAVTGPWMHDGAYTRLEDAVRHLLDPQQAMRDYDDSHLSPDLQGTFQDDPGVLQAMLATLDPLLAVPAGLSDREVKSLLAFLQALTSPSVAGLNRWTPASVPSGLPVD